MLHLYGIPATVEDAQWLVERLYAGAVAAAHVIENGVDRDLYSVALEPADRDAIRRQLEDCPDGLTELRGTLLRDHCSRHRAT